MQRNIPHTTISRVVEPEYVGHIQGSQVARGGALDSADLARVRIYKEAEGGGAARRSTKALKARTLGRASKSPPPFPRLE